MPLRIHHPPTLLTLLAIWLICASVIANPKENPTQQAFDKAHSLLRAGKSISALEHYEKALQQAPHTQDIWMEYTAALRQTKYLQRAVRAGWRALELGQPTAEIWTNLGNIFVDSKAWPTASQAYETAASLSKNKHFSIQNYLNLGYRLWLARQFPEAAKVFHKARQLDPNHAKTLLDMGALLASQGKIQEGSKQIRRAKKLLKKSQDLAGINYADRLLQEIKEKGKLIPPYDPTPYQYLPARFLKRPQPGKALAIKIDETVTRIYPLRPKGKLTLQIPEPWQELYEPPSTKKPAVVTYVPRAGDAFRLIATFLPVSYPLNEIKDLAQKSADIAAKTSMEKNIKLHRMQSKTTDGYYFLSADKEVIGKRPLPNKYPYLLSAVLKVGKSTGFFTLLSRTNEKKFIGHILGFIRGLRYSPG